MQNVRARPARSDYYDCVVNVSSISSIGGSSIGSSISGSTDGTLTNWPNERRSNGVSNPPALLVEEHCWRSNDGDIDGVGNGGNVTTDRDIDVLVACAKFR